MPTPATAAGTHRTVYARRTRLRRGVPRSAAAEGTRSSSYSESKPEESEVTASVVSSNRFAVLRRKEPAPGKEEPTIPLTRSSGSEKPMTLPFGTDIPSADQQSSGVEIRKNSLVLIYSPVPLSKQRSIPRLAHHSPAGSTHIESNQQPLTLAAASVAPAQSQPQPSTLALQAISSSTRPLDPSSTSIHTSPEFTPADPYLSLEVPDPEPTLPSPPTPPDPMSIPCLATLPIDPLYDLRYLTSPQASGPRSPQFAPPYPTNIDYFRADDPMHNIVSRVSGKIFSIAAEIAAVNTKSTTRPVGNVLVPGSVKNSGELERKSLVCRRERNEGSVEDLVVRSDDDEGGGAEEWMGKEEGFWKQPFEEGKFVKIRMKA